ncbi:signal peptidase I [Leucobacter luti]|uniref:signal peptidase I n=1 Tax=Leucobacter luti TaxID=340320 RepID=UPI003D03A264
MTEPGAFEAEAVGQEEPQEAVGRQPSAGKARLREAWSALSSGVMVGIILSIGLIALLAIALPAAGGGRALTVLTSSMEPTLPPGTMVVTMPVRAADVKVGDVLTYQLRSGEPLLVTHRVMQRLIRVDGSTVFLTQGDNNDLPDEGFVEEVQIVGTVRYSIPYLGWVTRLFTGEVGAWTVRGVVAALFVYAGVMLLSWIRDRRRLRKLHSQPTKNSVVNG